jgi:hypothetical protein
MGETLVKTTDLTEKKTSARNILKPVNVPEDLPTDRFQRLLDVAAGKMKNGSYTLWTHDTPNLDSLDVTLVNEGMAPHPEDSGEATPWAGLYELKHEGEVYYLIGIFQQGDYKFRKCYGIVGPTKDKVLALSESFQKGQSTSKRLLAPKYIFTPRNGRTPRPSYDWNKVVLPDEIRKQLQTNFSTFFKGPEAFNKAGVAYRRGILLTGAPGTGKTSILKAVMSQYPTIPFFVFEKTYDDVYVEDLRSMFAEAARLQPAVVVIEDIDRLVDSNSFPLADLLNVLDGLGTAQGVMVLATANNEGDIDPALVERPSRFDLVVRVPMPDKEHRKAYIVERSTSLEIKLADPELEKLLEATDKYTMAQCQEMFTNAVLTSFAEDTQVSYEHLLIGIKNMDNSLKAARKVDSKKKTGFNPLAEL